MTLSQGQVVALRNLARKQAGEEVDWINIADARVLTELGFAERCRAGWRITKLGLSTLQTLYVNQPACDTPGFVEHEVIQLRKDTMKESKGKPKKVQPAKSNASQPSLKGQVSTNTPPAKK